MAPETPSARDSSLLRAERDRQELRLKDVADAAGCSISLVSTCEAGYVPPLRTQERIAGALGASSGSFWPGTRDERVMHKTCSCQVDRYVCVCYDATTGTFDPARRPLPEPKGGGGR